MFILVLIAALQSAPPVAIPPPPAFPVIIWVRSEGSSATVRIALLNQMKQIARPVDEVLYAKLYNANKYSAVELHRVSGDERVPPGGYATEEYQFAMPKGVAGDAVLSFSNDGDGYRFQNQQK